MPETSVSRDRVRIGNRADGGYAYWLAKMYAFAALLIVVGTAVTAVWVYGAVARSAPKTPDLHAYGNVVPKVTRMTAVDGTVLGRFAKEWRELIPYDRIPKELVQAFLAVEDHAFFSHQGIYTKGIIRAAWRNITAGGVVEGGSTITQQVAKQFMGSQRTLSRKAKEAIVARRLESRYTKEEILSVYLNHIFLGSNAYGVQAAARRYFSRNVWQLDLGQMALIAGLARAPSRDSPLVSRSRAKGRRDVVLTKMARYGFIEQATASKWQAAPLGLAPFRSAFLDTSPYYAEHARRYVVAKYGADTLMKEGLTIETAAQPWMERVAYENVDWNARKQDKRQGWRGAEATLEGAARKIFRSRAATLYGVRPMVPGERYLGLVEEVSRREAKVLVGTAMHRLPLSQMRWASRWRVKEYSNDQKLYRVDRALRVGDVIWVSKPLARREKFTDWEVKYDEKGKPDAYWLPAKDFSLDDDIITLEQVPHPQAALIHFDWRTGYVNAMVGGSDHRRSQFNRAVQACRQPGSTYKPIYYALAMDEGYSFYTMLNDVAKKEAVVDPVTGKTWTPENLEGKVQIETSLESALVWSKNVPSVALFGKLGGDKVEKWARRLGFTSPIIPDKALALGASCTYPYEMGRAFAVFARNGKNLDLVFVRRVLDRAGNAREDHRVPSDPWMSPADRFDRIGYAAAHQPKQAIPARAAFLITKLLREVVRRGHARMVRQADIRAAGKTGTSSATMDMWFIGFTDRWLTVAWLGDDMRVRPLGRRDASYFTALPFWARYMRVVLGDRAKGDIPVAVPKGVDKDDQGGRRRRKRDRG